MIISNDTTNVAEELARGWCRVQLSTTKSGIRINPFKEFLLLLLLAPVSLCYSVGLLIDVVAELSEWKSLVLFFGLV